jgi:fumarate reductase (CoM/CoB) subunit B
MEEIILKIFRFDPGKNDAPYFKNYTVPIKRGMTVLDSLNYIKDNLDRTLTFRQSCRSAICGSCAIKINGKSTLACKTLFSEIKTRGSIRIEPLGHSRIIKDLVVDQNLFFRKIKDLEPWIVLDHSRQLPVKEFLMYPKCVKELKESRSCIFCGACYSECNAIDGDITFAGPHSLVKTMRFLKDPRDCDTGRTAQAVEMGLFKCIVCHECEPSCPKNINIGQNVIDLRCKAVGNHFGPLPPHKKIMENIKNTGCSISVKEGSTVDKYPEYIKAFKAEPQAEVVLFLGCILNRRQHNVAQSVINILQHNEIAVHLPKNQVCCGSPAIRTGQKDEILPVIKRNFDIFESYIERGINSIVTSCAGCCLTLRNDYPALSRDIDNYFKSKVFDVTEFLTKKIDLKEFTEKIDTKVMYHYPCHTRKIGLSEDLYLEFLQKIPEIEINKVPSDRLCCGGGGGVRTGYAELNNSLSRRRLLTAKNNKIDLLVTNCPYCYMSFDSAIELLSKEEKVGFTLDNYYTILAKGYGLK